MKQIRSFHFLIVIVFISVSAYIMGLSQLANSPIAEEEQGLE